MIEINWKPSARELRVFALLLVAFAGLVTWLLRGWLSPVAGGTIVAVAALLAVAGLLFPAVLRPLYIAWMVAVFPIGWLVSHLTLAGIFYLVFTPIGLLMRCLGRDPLQRKLDRAAASYWKSRPDTSEVRRYFRQY